MADTNLLAHAHEYERAWASSGVGRFLHPWHVGEASATQLAPTHRQLLCNLRPRPDAEIVQRESDATYRWLYSQLFVRPQLNDWPWRGRSRLPLADATGVPSAPSAWDACAAGSEGSTEATAEVLGETPVRLPAWATASSFIQAHDALWTPADAPELGDAPWNAG